MSLKLLIVCIGLLLFLAMTSNVVSQHTGFYSEPLPPRLYFQVSTIDGEPYLTFGPDYEYHDEADNYKYYYEFLVSSENIIELGSNENITLEIKGVEDRIYNPAISILFNFDLFYGLASDTRLAVQLRCNGDGDGNFEYIVNFEDVQIRYGTTRGIPPSSIIGEAINMTNATIELELNRIDDNLETVTFECWRSWVQVPFDLDTDGDGIGDYSDTDDDNDGHPDTNDAFPRDPSEWKDSDHDGIGDNADEDDNGNGIPDAFELPLVLCIIIIPIAIISAFVKRIKKSKAKKTGEEEEVTVPRYKFGPKNW